MANPFDDIIQSPKMKANPFDDIVTAETPNPKTVAVAPERSTVDYLLPSFMTKYKEKPGERTLTGDIFERPGAAVRSTILGKGYKAGALNPEKTPYLQDEMLKKYYDVAGTSKMAQVGGLAVSAAGLAADIVTNPADILTMIIPKAPGARVVGKAIAETKPAQAVARFATKERNVFKQAPQLEKEAVDMYRQILRPTQGEVKTYEIRNRGSIRDPLTIAAEERLPINVSKEGGVSKLDTVAAREQVKNRIEEIDGALTKVLDVSDKGRKYIDLKQIASEAKRQARAGTQNDTVYKSMVTDIDEYVNDAIQARARYVSAAELNDVKRGMYSVGYNMSKPTADKSARLVARAARAKIEKTFPDKDIAKINKTLGEYVKLNRLLENAHGRVVAGGRLGKYFAQGIGAGIGAAAGAPIPYVGPIAGGLAGRAVGSKVASMMASPVRLSAKAGVKAVKAGIAGRAAKAAMSIKP
jgi:hypothetical protein